MVGMNIRAYCPVCKCKKYYNIGIIPTIRYKNRKYNVIYCFDCKNEIAVNCLEPSHSNLFEDISSEVNDYTKKKISFEILKEFSNRKYTSKTKEEKIETEMFDFVKEMMGEEWAYKYEYEVKTIVQRIMSKTFNEPTETLESYLYEDIKNDSEYISTICC